MITVVVGKEIEKIKGDFESVINGMNMVGEIPYNIYSELYDEGTKQIQKAYELGKSELEKENAELKADNDARKFAMAMSEKVEKQLREEIAELKKQLEMSNKVYNDNLDYSHHIEGQLTKAKELLKEFIHHYKAKTIYIENMKDLLEQAEQFLNSEVEK